MREADKNGNNMYAILNTYTPKDNNNNASIEDAEVYRDWETDRKSVV